MEDYKIKVGITQGDINGIGYEIIIKTLADNRVLDFCVPVIYGSSKVAAFHRKSIEAPSFNLNVINNASEINTKRINIINCVDEEIKVELSKSTSIGGEAAIASLERATKDLKNGLIDVLVTAPINRKNISSELFNFQGHTEYLEHQFGQQGDALMLLVSDVMRIAIVTGHLPLKKVPEILTEKIIIDKLQTLVKTLTQDFAIRKPRIAVLGLNPHAGDNERLGKEEQEIIIPALQKAKDAGIICVGPFAADSFFGSGSFSRYDAVLAMYHDQGICAFKAINSDIGINYTASLPIIRTAPTHGPEYEIAGQNLASEESFRASLYLACDIYNNRKIYEEITKNSLKKQKIEISGVVE